MGRHKAGGGGGVSPILSEREERTCKGIVAGLAWEPAMVGAGYALSYARTQSGILSNNMRIQARIASLRALAAAPVVALLTGKILSEHERKVILSEIASARLTDYTHAGPDGDETNIGPESPNQAALSEITTVTRYDADGSKPRIVQRVKLRDPVQAIDLLNKMTGSYPKESGLPPGTTRIRITEIEIAHRAIDAQPDAIEGQMVKGLQTGESTGGEKDAIQ